MYIKGLGFIDENIYTNTIKPTSNTQNANPINKVNFDEMLATETAKLDAENEPNTYSLDSIFREASEKYNIPYDLLTSIAWHESRFQPDVTSSAGAMGLMQLMPGTAKAMGVENAYDPYQNVMGAAKLLSGLYDMYNGDLTLTLAAYAAGSGSVAKYGGVPPYGETREFVSTITSMVKSGGAQVPEVTVTSNSKSDTTAQTSSVTNTANSNTAIRTFNNTDSNTILNAYNTAKSNAVVAYEDNSEVYDKFYTASKLDKVLSYEDYQLLMYFFENMMEIVSNIGKTDVDMATKASSLFNNTSLFDNNTSNNNVYSNIASVITNPSTETISGELANNIITSANQTNMGAIISSSLFTKINDSNNK